MQDFFRRLLRGLPVRCLAAEFFLLDVDFKRVGFGNVADTALLLVDISAEFGVPLSAAVAVHGVDAQQLIDKVVEYIFGNPTCAEVDCDVIERYALRLHFFKCFHVALKRFVFFGGGPCVCQFGDNVSTQILIACNVVIFAVGFEEYYIPALLGPVLSKCLCKIVGAQVAVFCQRQRDCLLRSFLPFKID